MVLPSHVVGQAPPQVETLEEVEPAQPLALVSAQLAAKPGRGVGGAHPLEAAHLVADVGEEGVAAHLGHGLEQRVEQPRLVAPEAHVVSLVMPQPRQHAVLAHPLLREHAVAAVVEPDGPLAPPERSQQAGERDAAAAEVSRPVQFEPVDARGDTQGEGVWVAERLPLRLHVPAGFYQLPDGAAQAALRDRPGGGAAQPPAAPEPRLLDPLARRPLGFRVTQDAFPFPDQDDGGGRVPLGDGPVEVPEFEFGREIGGAPRLLPGADAQRGLRPRRRLLESEFRGEAQNGGRADVRHRFEPLVRLRDGDEEVPLAPEEGDPVGRAGIGRQHAVPDEDPLAENVLRGFGGQALAGAEEGACDFVALLPGDAARLHLEGPPLAVVPAEREQVPALLPEKEAAGGGDEGKEGGEVRSGGLKAEDRRIGAEIPGVPLHADEAREDFTVEGEVELRHAVAERLERPGLFPPAVLFGVARRAG